jgi:mercuric ion transport protein
MKANRYLVLIGSAIVAAMSTSLCCILPMIALVLGASGFAFYLGWMEPLRPYLAALSLVTLAIAWYRKLRHTGQTHCTTQGCSHAPEKLSFWESKKFLGIATFFSLSMLVFYYANSYLFPSDFKDNSYTIAGKDIREVTFIVPAMRCNSCEKSLYQAINQVPGVISVNINQIDKAIYIQFDNQKAPLDQLEDAINSIGYDIGSVKNNNSR